MKNRAIDRFPEPEEFYGISISHPILDDHIRSISLVSGDIREGDIVRLIFIYESYGFSLYGDGFLHGNYLGFLTMMWERE